MLEEFKATYLWAYRRDKGQFIRMILGIVAIIGLIIFIAWR